MVQSTEASEGVLLLPNAGLIAVGRSVGVSFASPRCVRSSW